MCIAIVSTAHPDYPFILLDNRDEYLHRPTSPAQWWPPPDTSILGGRDLHRTEHGTWLGVSRAGHLAVLTNFKEDMPATAYAGLRSRGAMVNAYLRMQDGARSEEVARRLIEQGVTGMGGFSLLFGLVRRPWWAKRRSEETQKQQRKEDSAWHGFAVVSNRSARASDVTWLCNAPGETHALSNSHYGDRSWPKVVSGETLVPDAIAESVAAGDSRDQLRDRLLRVLETDTLPRRGEGEDKVAYLFQLRKSIFIPVIGSDEEREKLEHENLPDEQTSGTTAEVVPASKNTGKDERAVNSAATGIYGTQTQTIVLVDWEGKATYFERTLFDDQGQRVQAGKGDRQYEFKVDGWDAL